MDEEKAALSFGPEKVVAEAAMLVHAAAGASPAPEVTSRIEDLCTILAPLARGRRVLLDLALHPSRAFKYAVPHVILARHGHPDESVDRYFRARCAAANRFFGDLPPSALLERQWTTQLWEPVWDGPPVPEPHEVLGTAPLDILAAPREYSYAVTHQVFYLTDFGRRLDWRLAAVDQGRLLQDVEALLLRYLDMTDYDLAGELLMVWPQLGVPWSPAATFAFRTLCRVEKAAGVLPCGNTDLSRLDRLEGRARRRYARATGYHTAFVMGFLCAVTLRSVERPPDVIEGDQYSPAVLDRIRARLDTAQGHWQEDMERAPGSELGALVPTLCNLWAVQCLRRDDFKGLGDVLALAEEAGLPLHPIRSAAVDRLLAVRDAMLALDV